MQKHLLKLSAISAALLLCHAAPVHAQATFPLNDTGQAQCYDGSTDLVACTAANTGDAAANPRQDGRFGRDAQAAAGQLKKIGGGNAGFDFTAFNAVDASGNPIPITPGNHECVKDNVTGLIWSTETLTGSSGYGVNWDAAMAAGNSYSHCGFNSGWRLPTLEELVSIVDYGNSPNSPAIDSDYFPNTQKSYHWSSDVYAPDSGYAWYVDFSYGYVGYGNKSYGLYVRLVRGGQ